MSEPYKTVVGLEVHVQLLTKTKLFCGCPTNFGLPPNSATCPVCLGMPGVLPVMNRAAFDLALRAATALDCTIAGFTKWDRKNYYYPDLPKNYQISQYDLPFSENGKLVIDTPRGPKTIGIIRAHLEEDAGKSMHDESGRGQVSKIDLNRTGTPLLEIVSQPDISAAEEAVTYLQELRLMLRELGVSDCEMQEGSLRCDANVNVHIPLASGGGDAPGYAATPIVEVKNLNSFKAVERAIKYEAQRQYNQFQEDGKRFGEVPKATAGWDDAKGITRIQRRKEEASDYRYFPEPDLMPVEVDESWLNRVRASLGELPGPQRLRLQSQYGLPPYDATVLVREGRKVVAYFEDVAAKCDDAKAAANWIANKLFATPGARTDDGIAFDAAALASLIATQKEMGLTKQISEQIFDLMLAEKLDAKAAVAKLGIKSVDNDALLAIVRKAIADNPKAIEDYKKGKTAAVQRIKGAVMKETKGAVKPAAVDALLAKELARV